MLARIIQTNDQPFKSVKIDPISLDIIESALKNARFEMDTVLFRTAMSPGIREQGDTFPMIANNDGKMVVGQFGSFIYGFTASYSGDIEEGDVILTSDPYGVNGAISHANDWLVLMPMFREGRLIGWASMFGHMTDVGGRSPGSLPSDATQLYQEAVVIPPVKIYRKGELQEDILELILRNCRMPDWNRSDLKSLIAACRVANLRCNEICERFGTDTFIAAMQELLDRNHRAMSQLFRNSISEEPQYFEDYICDDGHGTGPYKIACTLWREEDRLIFDFDGTDPQSPYSINFLLNEEMFKMFAGVLLIMVFDPQIVYNDGFYDLMEVRIPEGCLLRPRPPAALSCRNHALGRIFDIMSGLYGKGNPDFLNAAGFSDSPHFFYSGYDRNGEWFQLYQIGFGGIPGRVAGDGPDGHSLWPSFRNVSNEFIESHYPLRVETFETIPDSGGPGSHRGGNGLVIGYRFLAPGEISVHDDRWFTYPWGVKGGLPGGRSSKILERKNGDLEYLYSKQDGVMVEPGDILHFKTWGGGGWGDPLGRDPERVRTDVARGLVTREGARRYGVVLSENLTIDESATEKLRVELEEKRGEIKLFDFGGSIEELRTRCLEETHLEPPVAPELNVR
jgi:N-methylhydantoinase B